MDNKTKGEYMKAIAFLIASLFVGAAQADIIKCSFTEPFVNFEYSMTQSSMKVSGADFATYTVSNVSFQIMGPGAFELWDKNKNVVVRLYLDGAGSDGMSDYVYPYTANWNGLYGGCTSNFQAKSLVQY